MQTIFAIYTFIISLFIPQTVAVAPEQVIQQASSTIEISVDKEIITVKKTTPRITPKTVVIIPKNDIIMSEKTVEVEIVKEPVIDVLTQEIPKVVEYANTTTNASPQPTQSVTTPIIETTKTTYIKMETYEVSIGNQICTPYSFADENFIYATYPVEANSTIRKQGNSIEVRGQLTQGGEYKGDLGFKYYFTDKLNAPLTLEAFNKSGTFNYTVTVKDSSDNELYTKTDSMEIVACQ